MYHRKPTLVARHLVTLGRTVFTQNIEFSPMINSPSQAAKVLAKAVAKVAARNLNSDL